MALYFDRLDISPNGKQVIATDIDAVQLSIFRMMTTPRGSLPDFPNLGFEMEHFFGLSNTSAAFADLVNEFKTQVSDIVGNESVDVNVRRMSGGVVRFDIVYTIDGKSKSIGVSAEKDERNDVIFKNITLK